MKPIVIACDHAGYPLKVTLIEELTSLGYEALDVGCASAEVSVDYPDFGHALAEVVTGGQSDRGILICGTGIGISIAANRHPGIRAAVCHDETSVRLSREHNDANVLALGARLTGEAVAKACVKVFLSTPFAEGRHTARVAKLG